MLSGKWISICAALLVVWAVSPVFCQGVPSAITYQGKLTNTSSDPVSDGSRATRFKLYDAQTSGTQLWDSGAMNVVTTGGVFSVALGASPTPAITSATLTSGSVWLEVTVGTDPALPRVKLSSAPFALRSADLTMPFTKTVSSSPAFTPALEVKNTTANYAIRGEANNASFAGVMGDNTGSGFGVYGHTETGTAVRGYQQSSGNLGTLAGPDFGVLGSSSLGKAIWGSSTSGHAGYFEGKVRATGNLTTDGKVGIGLTDPDRKLYVVDNASGLTYPMKLDNPHSTVGTDAVGILFSTGGNGGNGLVTERGKGAVVYTNSGTWNRGNFHFLQEPNASAANPTLANAVMTITNAGNVGIGQTNPTAKLEVNGNLKVGDLAATGTTQVADLVVTGAVRGNLGSSGGAPFPRPAYNSGWIGLLPGSSAVFTHNLGGSIDDCFVDVQHKYGSDIGITNQGYGGDFGYAVTENHEFYRGFYWDQLTTTSIRVFRMADDYSALSAWVRVRIWVVK